MKNNRIPFMFALSASLFSCDKDVIAPENATVNVTHAPPTHRV
jgi:hypothetical protein